MVVDLSQAGAQIETTKPLRPGSRVHVRLVADGWSLAAAALVLRCVVSAVNANEGVTYRGGLRFDEYFPLPAVWP
jgi:hypothetical protein